MIQHTSEAPTPSPRKVTDAPRRPRPSSPPPRPHDDIAWAHDRRELAIRPSLLTPSAHLTRQLVAQVSTILALLVALSALVTAALLPVVALEKTALICCGLALVIDIATRLRLSPPRVAPAQERQEALAVAVVISGLVLATQLSGGGESPLLPLPFAAIALGGALLPRRATVAVSGWAALLLTLLFLSSPGPTAGWRALAAASTALGFGALASMILRRAALRFRDQAALEGEVRIQRLLEDARAYRLTGASGEGDADAQRKRVLAAVMAIRESYGQVLEVAQRALRPHTVLLLLLEEGDSVLRVRDHRSQSDHVSRRPIPARRGALGSVVARGVPVSLQRLDDGFEGITYYDAPVHPTSFLGVPVFEGEHLRGVLAVDRISDAPFSPADEALLSSLAREVIRAAEVERLFAVMDRDRRRQEALLRLTETLNTALTLDEALDALVEGLLAISGCEVAAVVLVEEAGPTVVRARGPAETGAIAGTALGDTGSLVASAIRAQTALPARGDLSSRRGGSRLFGSHLDPAELRRGKVLPLIHQGESVGALVVATRHLDALGEEEVRLLHVAAGYGAIALVNGRLYASMERMATRDGLTGLINHRTFQEHLEQALARARRSGQRLTLMLCDIDHFKQVNDTYGHPTGDEVLRRVAAALAKEARCTDGVARYGGEEFAVVMESTESVGGLQVAERIRLAVAAQKVATARGPLSVTLSAGLATFPEDASDRAALIKRSDEMLYSAKRGGRNQSRHAQGKGETHE